MTRKKTEEKEGDSKETKKEKKKRRDCIDAILEALNSKEFLEFDTEQMIKDKIKEFKENLNSKMVQCAKQNGEKGAAITQCQMGKGNRYPPVTGQILKTGESSIPNVARCLGDKGVALNMAIDKPCTK